MTASSSRRIRSIPSRRSSIFPVSLVPCPALPKAGSSTWPWSATRTGWVPPPSPRRSSRARRTGSLRRWPVKASSSMPSMSTTPSPPTTAPVASRGSGCWASTSPTPMTWPTRWSSGTASPMSSLPATSGARRCGMHRRRGPASSATSLLPPASSSLTTGPRSPHSCSMMSILPLVQQPLNARRRRRQSPSPSTSMAEDWGPSIPVSPSSTTCSTR